MQPTVQSDKARAALGFGMAATVALLSLPVLAQAPTAFPGGANGP
jgi:hypothetical protein